MDTTTSAVSPLRQRMTEDMRMRKLGPRPPGSLHPRRPQVDRLKVGDVHSERMALRVEQGKGTKDRYAMLSPVALQRLRAWRRVGQAQGKILPSSWLFPGLDPMEPLSGRQLKRVVHDPAAAGIAKRVTTHTLRHSLGAHADLGGLGEHDPIRRRAATCR
jgi:integrase